MDNSMGENIAILLLLLLFLVISVLMWRKITRPIFFKGIATGTIVSIYLVEDRRSFTRTELPVFEFAIENGDQISTVPLFVSPLGKFEVGEIYSLHYNMQSPQEFIVNSTKHSIFTFPVVITSIIVIAVSVMFLFALKTFFL